MKKTLSFIYLWQLHDEIVCIGVLGSSFNLRFRHTFTTISNVLFNGCCKQYRFLTDYANVLSQPLNVQFSDVSAVNADSAL